jgi:hypothetical protein
MILTRFAVASLWLVLVLFLGSADFAAQETETIGDRGRTLGGAVAEPAD